MRGLFAEYLYLRPGNDKVSYAVPIDGAIVAPEDVAPIQIGDEAVVDPGFSSGYRVGGNVAVSPLAALSLTYTHFDASDADRTAVDSPFVLRSLVAHPGTQTSATDFLEGAAQQEIRFDLVDLTFSRELWGGPHHIVCWQLGPRYGKLEQTFDSTLTSSTRIDTVNSRIEFHGGGLQFGLSAARHILGRNSCAAGQFDGGQGWSLYGRTLASFLAGRFEADYVQQDNFSEVAVVDTGWREERIVPILDLELGIAWTSNSERLHLSAGYLFSGWYNTVGTDQFIDGVRHNSSIAIDDTLTFDGLVVNAEYRF
jgi:hypothetical protein